jgi:hypothetical protein
MVQPCFMPEMAARQVHMVHKWCSTGWVEKRNLSVRGMVHTNWASCTTSCMQQTPAVLRCSALPGAPCSAAEPWTAQVMQPQTSWFRLLPSRAVPASPDVKQVFPRMMFG